MDPIPHPGWRSPIGPIFLKLSINDILMHGATRWPPKKSSIYHPFFWDCPYENHWGFWDCPWKPLGVYTPFVETFVESSIHMKPSKAVFAALLRGKPRTSNGGGQRILQLILPPGAKKCRNACEIFWKRPGRFLMMIIDDNTLTFDGMEHWSCGIDCQFFMGIHDIILIMWVFWSAPWHPSVDTLA